MDKKLTYGEKIMKLFILRMIVVCVILLNLTTAFAWTTYSDSSNGFQINFPCTPQKLENTTQNHILNVYNCEESFNDKLILYHVYITSKKNGVAIRYKQDNVNLALKNFVIGGLQMYGVSQNNITFQTAPNFQGKFPAVNYCTNEIKGGIVAEGISSLIKGKHIKIGIMYEPSIKDEAKNRLQLFLNSFKLK
jgi:hypothetical protein